MTWRVAIVLVVGSIALTGSGIFVVWVLEPFELLSALWEYVVPTTVEMEPIPGCAVTKEAPPEDLAQIVQHQMLIYHLSLQKMIVCKSGRKYPALERRFAGLPFGEQFRMRWRPLPDGCCSCQYRRHVVVVAANSGVDGSVVVEAALVQSRSDHLVQSWNKVALKFHRITSYLAR